MDETMNQWIFEHSGAVLGTDIKGWPVGVRSEIGANAHKYIGNHSVESAVIRKV